MTATYPLTPPAPTLSGFIAWVRSAMAIPATVIPDDSTWMVYAFNVAMSVVNPSLASAAGPIYLLAVYNLGGSNLINWAQDPDPPVFWGTTKTPYLQYLRKEFTTLAFVPGVVNSTADETTSESMEMLEQYRGYTLANLQQLKDPYGRTYLGFAADYGPLWGLS